MPNDGTKTADLGSVAVSCSPRRASGQSAALPLGFPKVHGDKRRALVPRFPCGLYFATVRDQVVVVGVLHGHRDPTVLTSRR